MSARLSFGADRINGADASATPDQARRAERALTVARAAVRTHFSGPGLAELPGKNHMLSTLRSLEDALVVYVAATHFQIPIHHLAVARRQARRDLRKRLRLAEHWREAPGIDALIGEIERACPKDL